MQLLGLHKKSKQVINLSDVKKAAVVYRKNVRLSPIDFNPDYLNLILDLGKETNMTLTLGNVDYQQLNSIMGLLQDKNIVVDDKQNILQLLRENKNLFNHFHKKGWTSL